MQKFFTLRKGLVAPIQKASRSVSDVMVTEMADDRNVSDTRSSSVFVTSVWRQPDMSINMSSTPTPANIMSVTQHCYTALVNRAFRALQAIRQYDISLQQPLGHLFISFDVR